MTTDNADPPRKAAQSRERDLRMAVLRLQKRHLEGDDLKITFAAVAREAGVSTALIHNYYPAVADQIRSLQGRTPQQKEQTKDSALKAEQARCRELRSANEALRAQVARLASINETLLMEVRELKAQLVSPKVSVLKRPTGGNGI